MLPTLTEDAEAASVSAMSATGLTVVLTLDVLFAGTGSASFAVTLAVFVTVPSVTAFTVMVTVAFAPFVRGLMVQEIGAVPVQPN